MPNVEIRVAAVASLNRRPYQLMIDPTRDLAKATYGLLKIPDWIIPLDEHAQPGNYPTTHRQRQAQIDKIIQDQVLPALQQNE